MVCQGFERLSASCHVQPLPGIPQVLAKAGSVIEMEHNPPAMRYRGYGDALVVDGHEADRGWSDTRFELLPWATRLQDGLISSWMRPGISVPTGGLVVPMQDSVDSWNTNTMQYDGVFAGDLS